MEIKSGYFEQRRTMKNVVTATEVSGIPAEDRTRVVQTAQLVFPQVVNWVKDYPPILPLRIPSTCLACTAMCPEADLAALTEVSVLSLILFAQDDIGDGIMGTYTDAQIEQVLIIWDKIVQDGGSRYQDYPALLGDLNPDQEQPWAQLTGALTRFCRELQTFPYAEAYYQFFARHFTLAMKSMRVELYDRQTFERTRRFPTYAHYMSVGRESIGASFIVAALLVMIGAPPTDPAAFYDPEFESLDALLDELALTCAASIRLSNDIRSFERELLEQKPNSLLIMMLAEGWSEQTSEAFALSQIDVYLEKMEPLIAKLPTSLQLWGASLRRLGRFAKDWYQTREFHDFPKEMLAQLAK